MTRADPSEQKSTWRRVLGWLRERERLRATVPGAVAVGLLAYVISIAVSPRSGAQLWEIVRSTWWAVLLLTFPYLALRALVWRNLLEQLDIKVPARPMLVSFASGEMLKSVPAGVYVQNYLLARLEHFGPDDVARSYMATTAMLGLEAALAFPVALILGWPGRPSVRWALFGVVVAWTVALAVAWALVRYGARHLRPGAPGWVRAVVDFLEEFLEAGGRLISWKTLPNLLPTALYLIIYVIDIYLILHALGVHSVGALGMVNIYAVITLSNILVPIPTELGMTEFAGMTIVQAYGLPLSTAAVVVLSLRALATGATILLSVAILVLLRKQFRGF